MDIDPEVPLGEEDPAAVVVAAAGGKGESERVGGEEEMGGGGSASGGGGGEDRGTPGDAVGGFTPPSDPAALLPSPGGNLGAMVTQTQEEVGATQTQEEDQTQTQTQTLETVEESRGKGAAAAGGGDVGDGKVNKKVVKKKPLLNKKRLVVDGCDAAAGGAPSIELPGEVIRSLLQDREPLLDRKVRGQGFGDGDRVLGLFSGFWGWG
jgi:hypothetical protein